MAQQYYAIYERPSALRQTIPFIHLEGHVSPYGLPFVSLASGEENVEAFPGSATVEAHGLPLQHHIAMFPGDGQLAASGLEFITLAVSTEALDVKIGLSEISSFGGGWASESAATVNIVPALGDGTVAASPLLMVTQAAATDNIDLKAGLGEVSVSGNVFLPLSSSTEGIDPYPGAGDVSASGIAYSALPGASVGIPSKAGLVEVSASGNVFITNASGQENIDVFEQSSDVSASGLGFSSLVGEPEEVNLSNKFAEADVSASGLLWNADASGEINVDISVGGGDISSAGLFWSSQMAFVGNIDSKAGLADVAANGLLFAGSALDEENIPKTIGACNVSAAGIAFDSLGTDTENITEKEGLGEVWSHGLLFVPFSAASTDLDAFEGQASQAPSGLPFVSEGTATANIDVYVGQANNDPAGLPFTTSASPPVNTAVCLDGNAVTPAYLATNLMPEKYNTDATHGYLSVWYQYNGTDQDMHFAAADNVIFTVWGGVEGDRIEFGLRNADPPNFADLYIETSTALGNNEVRGVTVDSITDGEWHHLVYGSYANSWYMAVDGLLLTGIVTEFGTNTGEWFSTIQRSATHEVDVGATLFSDAVKGTEYLHGCLDELMIVNNRNPNDHPADIEYLYNDGGGILIPDVEIENVPLWNAVHHAWPFDSGNVGDEYVDGIYDFNNVTGVLSETGISGKHISRAISISQYLPNYGLRVRYADKDIPLHNGVFTVAAWCRFDEVPPPGTAGLATKLMGALSEWALWYDPAQNRFRGALWTAPNTQTFCYPPVYDVQPNKWYFVVMRVYGGVVGLQLGIGAEDAPFEWGSASLLSTAQNSTSDVMIGSYGSSSNVWHGAVDDVMYWTRWLLDAEVSQLFASGDGIPFASWPAGLKDSSLVFHFGNNAPQGVRFDSWGVNVGSDGGYYKALPTLNREPGTEDGHIQEP